MVILDRYRLLLVITKYDVLLTCLFTNVHGSVRHLLNFDGQ